MPLIDPDDPATWTNEWRIPKIYAGQTIRFGYLRKLILPTIADTRAEKLIEHLNLTAASIIWIGGGDYGWTQYCLEQKLPGISVATIDASTLVQERAIKNELEEIEAELIAAGIERGSPAWSAAIADLYDGQNKALTNIYQTTISLTKRIEDLPKRLKAKSGSPDFYIFDGGFPWLSDELINDTIAGMRIDCPNLVFIVSLKSTRGTQTPGLNWKTKEEYRALETVQPEDKFLAVGKYEVF